MAAKSIRERRSFLFPGAGTIRRALFGLIAAAMIAGCGGSPAAGAAAGGRAAGTGAVAERHEPAALPHPEAHPADAAVRDLGLTDWDTEVRLETALGLAGVLSADQLQVALSDQSPTVRRAAVESLRHLAGDEMSSRVPRLAEALQDPDEAVREAAVEVLAMAGGPRSVALLLEARGDSSPIVREEAAEALYRLRRREAPGAAPER